MNDTEAKAFSERMQSEHPGAFTHMDIQPYFANRVSDDVRYAVVGIYTATYTPPKGRQFEVRSEEDYQQLIADGCVHNWSVGLRSDNYVTLKCYNCRTIYAAPYADVVTWMRQNYEPSED